MPSSISNLYTIMKGVKMNTLLHVHPVDDPAEILHYLPDKLYTDQCLVIIQRHFVDDDFTEICQKIGQVISKVAKIAAVVCEPGSQKSASIFQAGAGLSLPLSEMPTVSELDIVRSLHHGQAVLITSQNGDNHVEEAIRSLTGRQFCPHIIKPGNICLLLFEKKVRIYSERYLDFLFYPRKK